MPGSPWDNWSSGQPPLDAPDPGRDSPIGHAHYLMAQAQAAETPRAGGAPPPAIPPPPAPPATRTGNAAPPAYTPSSGGYARQPTPGALTQDTIRTAGGVDYGPGLMANPATRQVYSQNVYGEWAPSRSLSTAEAQQLARTAPAAPGLPSQNQQTAAAIGNSALPPELRNQSGLAAAPGTLTATNTPHFASLADYRQPGVGFAGQDYRPMSMPNLDNVRLPTTVTRGYDAKGAYGFDFGHPESFQGAKAYGPAMISTPNPQFQVPNGYMPGPSGFSANGPNGAYFAPVALPFGVQNADAATGRPGGGGALILNGPQTFDVRNGGIGFGANANTILNDYGRSGLSGDGATRAAMAMQLMDTNERAQRELGMSPLDAYIAMNTPSTSNYGAPVGSYAGGAGNAGSSGAGAGAYGPDGPDRGFKSGGNVKVMMPKSSDIILGREMKGAPTMRPFASGGSVSYDLNAPPPSAGGGGRSAPPNLGSPLGSPTTYSMSTAAPAIAAQSPAAASQSNTPSSDVLPTPPAAPAPAPAPVYVPVPTQPTQPAPPPGPVTNPGGYIVQPPPVEQPTDPGPLVYAGGGSVTYSLNAPRSTAADTSTDAAPPSPDIAPATPQATLTAGNVATDVGKPPIAPPGPAPTPTAGPADTSMNTGLDTPEGQAALRESMRAHLRDAYGSGFSAAGVHPIGITSDQPINGLPPGVYARPTDYSGLIRDVQTRMAALGDVSGDPYQLMQEAQQVAAGYGGNGPGMPGWQNPNPALAAQLQQQAQNILQAQQYRNQINNLRSRITAQGFKSGGTVNVGMPHQMVTQEPIIGVGVQTGKPQFIVGEPRRPGGPPAPERLSIKPLPMSVRKKAA